MGKVRGFEVYVGFDKVAIHVIGRARTRELEKIECEMGSSVSEINGKVCSLDRRIVARCQGWLEG